MINKIKICLALSFGISVTANSQIEGDILFLEDQIVKIELNFSQVNYFDSLETNYSNSTYMKADLIITDNSGSTSYTDVGVRLKGNSTYSHPNDKKSFKIDFNKYITSQNYDGLKKLNFNNNFKDPSMMREKIFFDVCKDVGVAAPRANFANVYFNGVLWGFYTVVEQIDDQFLDWKIGDDAGNLFKAGDNFGNGGPGGGTTGSEGDLVDYGFSQTAYADRYELKTNENINDWTDLIDFINFINNSTDNEFETQLENRFELDEFLYSLALDNLFSNLDSYIGSARNWYLYHNETSNKWHWIKWDANESFGSYANGQNVINLPLDYVENERPLVERIFESPSLTEDYEAHVCTLLSNYFNSDSLNPKIDAYYNLIQQDVYADSKKMYSNANFDQIINSNITSGGGPMGGTTYGIKPFILSKMNYAQSQLSCEQYLQTTHEEELDFSLYPVPSNDYLTIKTKERIDHTTVSAINGEIIFTEYDTNKLNIRNLSKGIYIVTVFFSEANSVSKKFVKE